MSAMTTFYQNCPVCGRSLRISVKHFGRQMSCTHCQGEFRAGKDELAPKEPPAIAAEPAYSVPIARGTPHLGEV
jgi:hypothetical protein